MGDHADREAKAEMVRTLRTIKRHLAKNMMVIESALQQLEPSDADVSKPHEASRARCGNNPNPRDRDGHPVRWYLSRRATADVTGIDEHRLGKLLYNGWFRFKPTSSKDAVLRPRYIINVRDVFTLLRDMGEEAVSTGRWPQGHEHGRFPPPPRPGEKDKRHEHTILVCSQRPKG